MVDLDYEITNFDDFKDYLKNHNITTEQFKDEILPNTSTDVAQLRKDFEDLKLDIEDILHDQNDINESTRLQLETISTALAELQSKEPRPKPRRRIGFIQDDSESQSSEE